MSRKSVARLTDHPDMTLDVYRGRNTITTEYSIYIAKAIRIIWVTNSADKKQLGQYRRNSANTTQPIWVLLFWV